MGVANTFTFGGISTSAYGLVVEGSGDYSAPKRAVESITIPGRNGAYILDKGYYENTDVEYRVVVTSDNHGDFLDSIEAFRNAIVSLVGYQRLEDTYHPGEYRMAAYSGGLEEDPTFIGKNAVFKVKFDCKPQRWLTSGETKQTIANSGDTITNPTLFEASPLLEVEGYGTISFNGYEIELDSGQIGEITLSNGGSGTQFGIDENNCNVGDDMFVLSGSVVKFYCSRLISVQSVTITPAAGNAGTVTYEIIPKAASTLSQYFWVNCNFDQLNFFVGTSADKIIEFDISSTNSSATKTAHVWVKYSYVSDENPRVVITYNITGEITETPSQLGPTFSTKPIKAISTISRLGNPTYIDCDIGEAYLINAGTPISLNQYIDLGSKLPILTSGSNAITFDNTITDLKVTPRWWRV